MEEEFKKPQPISQNFLSVSAPVFGGSGKKVKSAKPQIEFVSMMENNKDPLGISDKPLRNYTLDEVALHNKPNDAWIVINGKVYDFTLYLDYHPGGKIIMNAAGMDGTHLFNRYHPWVSIDALLGKLRIGNVISYIG